MAECTKCREWYHDKCTKIPDAHGQTQVSNGIVTVAEQSDFQIVLYCHINIFLLLKMYWSLLIS